MVPRAASPPARGVARASRGRLPGRRVTFRENVDRVPRRSTAASSQYTAPPSAGLPPPSAGHFSRAQAAHRAQRAQVALRALRVELLRRSAAEIVAGATRELPPAALRHGDRWRSVAQSRRSVAQSGRSVAHATIFGVRVTGGKKLRPVPITAFRQGDCRVGCDK